MQELGRCDTVALCYPYRNSVGSRTALELKIRPRVEYLTQTDNAL